MTIKKLTLENFTVFEHAQFEFCPGINVLMGENGTGKTHVLKMLNDILKPLAVLEKQTLPGGEEAHFIMGHCGPALGFEESYQEMFPRSFQANRADLIRNQKEQAVIEVNIDDLAFSLTLDRTQQINFHYQGQGEIPENVSPLFIPSQEVVSIFPGFISSWLKRENNYDHTYFDLCVELEQRPLKNLPAEIKPLVILIEEILGGNILLENGQFLLQTDTQQLKMPMLAEGWRKFAMVAWLLMNGAINKHTTLFWDEPETNLNPKLTAKMKTLLLALAKYGVQIFVATHDYLLASDLSLVNEGSDSAVPIRFFSLYHAAPAGAKVESAELMTDLQHNAILEEFAAHYDRETLALGAVKHD